MANYTSLEQAQAALADVNKFAEVINTKRESLFADQSDSLNKLNNLKTQANELIKIKEENSFFSEAYQSANEKLHSLANETAQEEKRFANIKTQIRGADSYQREIDRDLDQINKAITQFETPGAVVTDVTATNPDSSAAETAAKMANAEIIENESTAESARLSALNKSVSSGANRELPAGITKGAMPARPTPASVDFKSMAGTDTISNDTRVRIIVPNDYLTTLTSGANSALKTLKGVIFPYTPTVSIKHSADYNEQKPIHSNYSIYFYQRSKVDPINISGKFVVQNENDANTYIATVHLLRSLTKMRSGGATGDADSGAPPPVCRLNAYGTFMLQNVPVVISSFSINLPDNIDYYTVGKTGNAGIYEKTSVPTLSTIEVTCIPVYSRDEMRKFNVTQWLGEKYVRKAGYL